METMWLTNDAIEKNTLPEVIFAEDVPLQESQKLDVIETIASYIQNFNLEPLYKGKVIHITAFSQEQQNWLQSMAQTTWMTISLNLLAWYASKTSLQIKNIIRHEMWHTIPTVRSNNLTFTLQNGDTVVGAVWLSPIVVPQETQEETKIMVMEEAMCDLLAFDHALIEGVTYDIVNYASYSCQLLLMKLCKEKNVSSEMLIQYHHTGNILWFTQALLWCVDPDAQDVEYLMGSFELLKQWVSTLIQDAENVVETNPWRLAMLPNNIAILTDRAVDKIHKEYGN